VVSASKQNAPDTMPDAKGTQHFKYVIFSNLAIMIASPQF